MAAHDRPPLFRITGHVNAPTRRDACAALAEYLLSAHAHGAVRVAHGTVYDVHVRAGFPGTTKHRRGEPKGG